MRLELTRVGLLVELANHYTTRGDLVAERIISYRIFIGQPMRTLLLFTEIEGKLLKPLLDSAGIVIYKALCFGVAQGRMNGTPNETRTHSCRFVSLIY